MSGTDPQSSSAEKFPVFWDHPADAESCWSLDSVREPITPLEFSILGSIYISGFSGAARALGLDASPPKLRRINTYVYTVGGHVRVGVEDIDLSSPSAFVSVLTNLEAIWEDEYLPTILQRLSAWESFNLGAASLSTLQDHLEAALSDAQDLSELHFRILWPSQLAMSEFDELYREVFRPDDPFESYRLIQGLDNQTLKMGRALWNLSRSARAQPEVLEVIKQDDPEVIASKLGNHEHGRIFLATFRQFLRTYGTRSDHFGLRLPSWIEDPTSILAELKSLVDRPDQDDRALRIAQLAEEREREVRRARMSLKNHPQAVVSRFEILLQAAQSGSVIREDHEHYIDSRMAYGLRQILLEIARRLCDNNVLDTPDDVFMLTLEELNRILDHFPHPALRDVVSLRQKEMKRFATVRPPDRLGMMIVDYPPSDIFGRTMKKTNGSEVTKSRGTGVLEGIPGSPGFAQGPARVLHSIAEIPKVRSGDVVVTDVAGPAWTPLFSLAAAVVTNAGGVLSHCAVVAREYRIPAVVGVGTATDDIDNGQIVEVDGTSGRVTLVQ